MFGDLKACLLWRRMRGRDEAAVVGEMAAESIVSVGKVEKTCARRRLDKSAIGAVRFGFREHKRLNNVHVGLVGTKRAAVARATLLMRVRR